MSVDSTDRNNHSNSTVSGKPSRLKKTLISVTVAVLATTTLLSACGGTQGSSSSSTSDSQSSSESAPKKDSQNESDNNQNKESSNDKGLSASQVAKDLGYKTVGEAGTQNRQGLDEYIDQHLTKMGYQSCYVDSKYEVKNDGIKTNCAYMGKNHSGHLAISTSAKSDKFDINYLSQENLNSNYETESSYIPSAEEADKVAEEKLFKQ
ncbi:hypothetical protein OZX72_04285 [Bifidobacterium sp. ESL0769]|uniref:hypothetical protein n=1 Tax=Bifidobacterium sp. ESL0769 TaxID=2983229 RepID=UPI0023F8FBDE|nr:hypothetical protein [Bifidobacterium sp. ESL0769]WEV68202.1 hypothetical protein OZX72_04285 [Bifidobacterium sp. ESL0769]